MSDEIYLKSRVEFSKDLEKALATVPEGPKKDQQRAYQFSKFEEARAERNSQITAQMHGFDKSGGALSRAAGTAANSLFTGTLHGLNSALAGNLPRLATAVAGPESGGRFESSLEATAEQSPTSATIGGLGGFFVGPQAKLAQTSANLVRPVTRPLVKHTAEKGFAAKFGAQFLQNMATGGAAITSHELVRERNEADYNLPLRLNEIQRQISSGVNLAVSGGLGVASAKYTNSVTSDPELRRAITDIERLTGKKVDVATLTDIESWQRFYAGIRRFPGVSDVANRVVKKQQKMLLDYLDEIGRHQGVDPATGQRAVRKAAARGVRRLQGDRSQVDRALHEDLPAKARRAKEKAAFAVEGQNQLDVAATDKLALGLRAAEAARKLEKGDLGVAAPIVRKLRKLTGRAKGPDGRRTGPRRQATLNELENVRQQVGDLAFSDRLYNNPNNPAISSAARRELKQIYSVLDEAIEGQFPKASRAMKDGRYLRKMSEALNPEKIQMVDDSLMADFFNAKGFTQRWKALKQFGSPEDLQMARAWYFKKFIADSVNPNTGAVTQKSIRLALNKNKSLYNDEIFQTVLPGAKKEMLGYAKLSETMNMGLAQAENSATSSRFAEHARVIGTAGGAAAFVAALLRNPYTTLTHTLGVLGVGLSTEAILQSSIDGVIQQHLQNLARAAGPPGVSRLAPAMQSLTREDVSSAVERGRSRIAQPEIQSQ